MNDNSDGNNVTIDNYFNCRNFSHNFFLKARSNISKRKLEFRFFIHGRNFSHTTEKINVDVSKYLQQFTTFHLLPLS